MRWGKKFAGRKSETALFVERLRSAAGEAAVLTSERATLHYRQGYRVGGGSALAVVRPSSLVALWRTLEVCIDAGKIVLMQAANTGLTGGSTPTAEGYDREVVIISTLALDGVHPIADGRQVVCLAGATLNTLERVLAPLGREPHSVIGSSCIGASVIGGVCNNSGGSLVRRGPAFTELALYAQVGADGRLELVNHLGIRLPDAPEAMLERLERGRFNASEVIDNPAALASDRTYATRVRRVDDPRPARFNADPHGLYEASGSAGKLCVFAVRLDSFPRDGKTQTFYIGTNDPIELSDLRRHMLASGAALPVSAEYMNRDAFDVAAIYGKDAFLVIELLGTERLPALLRASRWFDAMVAGRGKRLHASDQLLQRLGKLLPAHLPSRLRDFRNRYEHHLLLKMADDGIDDARRLIAGWLPSKSGDWFECSKREERKAFLHRYVTAGAAIRFRNLHPQLVEDVVSLDVALRRDDSDPCGPSPRDISEKMLHVLSYGHFFCHVFHQDYVVRKGSDVAALKVALCKWFDARGAEYPAEHNVGHSYRAKPALADFYRALDPRNIFNPGIGETSLNSDWR